MKISLRGPCKSARAPLERVIDRTAAATGLDDVTVARVSTYLWEHIAEEVARGEVVSIPSFGAFGAWLDERWRTRQWMKPVFSPCAAFKAQVSLTAPITRKPKKKIAKHRDNNAFDEERNYTHKRVWSSMAEIRQGIDDQMAGG